MTSYNQPDPDPVIPGSGYGDAEYFFTASCSAHFANTGEIPVLAGDTAGTVSLTLPEDSNYVLVGLPNE